MKKLVEHKRKIIGLRIKEVREKLWFSHSILAKGTGISERTIIAIEKGTKGYNIDSLLYIAYFLGMELEEVANPKTKIQSAETLEAHITAFHASHNSKKFSTALKRERPNIKHTITEKVLKTDFLQSPREIWEIVEYCKSEFNIRVKGTSLSNALKRLSKEGVIKITKSGSKSFLYKKASRKQ